jgi:glycosyltransferase involved in cell wall biosynthesis
LQRFLGVDPGKVAIVPLGVDATYLADVTAVSPARPYFLNVGNHRSHKDLATLFAAWEALDPACEADLVLTGDDDLPQGTAHPRRARGELRFIGNVDAVRLAEFYKGAVALVHPALCEGFGLPMLEAAAVGAAVIACDDAVPAVLRPYVDVFPPRDVRTLAALMARALAEPRARDEARRLARTLTWDRCAERTAEVYRTVLQESPSG